MTDPGDGAATGARRARVAARLAGWVTVPVLLAAVCCGPADRAGRSVGGSDTATTSMAGAGPAPLTVVRRGAEVTLGGDLPDPVAKQTLLDLVFGSFGDRVTVVDQLGVAANPGVPDLRGAGPVFEAAEAIPDFALTVDREAVTLRGTAVTARDKNAVVTAAEDAWPDRDVVDRLHIDAVETSSPN